MKSISRIIKPNQTLVKNFTSLSLLQLSNYIFPLITLPYLVRVLGPEKYGLINFAAAFTTYFTILTDYGFNLSATQEISINREDKKKVSEIFSSVMNSKLILYLISTIIFYSCLISFNIFKEHSELFFISYAGLIGTVLFPLWYFQGIEKMNIILAVNFVTKLFSLISIFLFIKKNTDYLLLALIYSLSQVLYGILGLMIVIIKFKVKFYLIDFENIFKQIRKSSNLFISSLSIASISNSSVFILGLFVDKSTVGYFAGADKIRIAFQSLLSTIFTTTFPRVSILAKKSIKQFYNFNRKSFYVTFTLGLIISLLIYFGAPTLVKVVLGDSYENSIPILKLLSIVPFLYSISNFLGVQIFLPLNYAKHYAAILFITLIVHMISAIALVNFLQAIGSSIAIILTEIITIVLLLKFLVEINKRLLRY